ncbi:MAG: hypothetical protein WCF67_25185 [Chitinophagaceae bacterium]
MDFPPTGINVVKFFYTGTAEIYEGEPVFSFDLSYSGSPFYLKGLKRWNNKYLGKRIAISGRLVAEGYRNVFETWIIVACDCGDDGLKNVSQTIKSLRPLRLE